MPPRFSPLTCLPSACSEDLLATVLGMSPKFALSMLSGLECSEASSCLSRTLSAMQLRTRRMRHCGSKVSKISTGACKTTKALAGLQQRSCLTGQEQLRQLRPRARAVCFGRCAFGCKAARVMASGCDLRNTLHAAAADFSRACMHACAVQKLQHCPPLPER